MLPLGFETPRFVSQRCWSIENNFIRQSRKRGVALQELHDVIKAQNRRRSDVCGDQL